MRFPSAALAAVAPVVVLAFVEACASAPTATPRTSPAAAWTISTGQSDGIALLRGKSDLAFGTVRPEVARLSRERAVLRLRASAAGSAATLEDVVQLPLTTKAADVALLVIVQIFHGRVRVSATDTASDAELTEAARRLVESPHTVALLRVDDAADLGDVIHASKALQEAGIEARVLGSVGPSEPAPQEWGSTCPYPANVEDRAEGAVVKVVVDDDGHGRAGAVHVLDSPQAGFAWAAVVCATLNRFAPTSAMAGQPRVGRPLAIRFSR